MSWDTEDFVRYGGGWARPGTGNNYHPSQSSGPRRGKNPDAKLVEAIQHNLNRLDVNPGPIAGGLVFMPTPVQQNFFDIVLLFLAGLAERDGRYPGHAMETAFKQARQMIDAISTTR